MSAPAIGQEQKLVAQVRDKDHLAAVIDAMPPFAWLRLAPFLISEVFGLPFRHPDGYYLRLDGVDVWQNADGSYEVNPTLTRTDAP